MLKNYNDRQEQYTPNYLIT